MEIVVTGASGHLGKSLVHLLASQGHLVVAASRRGTIEAPFGKQATGEVRAHALDLATDACVDVLAEALAGGSALVHLAAWHPHPRPPPPRPSTARSCSRSTCWAR